MEMSEFAERLLALMRERPAIGDNKSALSPPAPLRRGFFMPAPVAR